MQTLSTALQNAIDSGNPQRVLLVFGNDEFSNEDIVIDSLGFINLKNVGRLEVSIFDKIDLIRRKGML